LTWVVSRGRSEVFLWADSIFQKCEEGRSNFGLFASKRLRTFSRRFLKSIGRHERKHRRSKLANPTYKRIKLSRRAKKRVLPFSHMKPLRLFCECADTVILLIIAFGIDKSFVSRRMIQLQLFAIKRSKHPDGACCSIGRE
jgi:hypothetical protein